MSESPENVMEKIRKCLALARCAGEGEAAAALEAARRLMERHGITESALLVADVGESRANATVRRTPAEWEAALANTVGRAFGCAVYFVEFSGRRANWNFIGPKPAAPVASYAFVVLLRRVRSARREHVRRFKRCGQRRQRLRGDLFCFAWVAAVREKVAAFAGAPAMRAAVEAYVAEKYNRAGEVEVRNRLTGAGLSHGDMSSWYAGRSAGAEVELRHGVADGGREGPCLLVGGN